MVENKKQIAILGSTGSIGTQALEVIEENSGLFEVYAITANNQVDLLIEQARKFLKDNVGQKDTALVIHDGCGLCTHNHLSPLALTAVLRYAYNHKPIYRMLNRQLSISGVDGTLRREISDPAIRGRIHGKTGTLSHPYGISSLAGYCKGTNGHVLAFAVIASEMSVLDAHVLQQRLCKILCLSPKPLPASAKTGRAH